MTGCVDARADVPLHTVISSILERVDEAEIRTHLSQLVGAGESPIRSRSVYHDDIQLAEQYLSQALARQGLEVSLQPFPFAAQNRFALHNIEGVLPGAEEPSAVLMVGAHYDSTAQSDVSWDARSDPAPGADDNATGCAVVMETARVLSRLRLQKTVRFVLFSAEEVGLIGSRHYAETVVPRGDDLRAFVNMDPVGNGSTVLPDKLFFTFNESSSEEAERMERIGERFRIPYEVVAMPGDTTIPDQYSDHQPFWERGVVALHGGSLPGQTNHTVQDTLDGVDIAFVAASTKVVVAYLVEQAGFIGFLDAEEEEAGCSCSTI